MVAWQDSNLRPLRPERDYLSRKANKNNEFRIALAMIIIICSRGFGGQSVVRTREPLPDPGTVKIGIIHGTRDF